MRITIAAHTFYPESTGVGIVATRHAMGLAEVGHDVSVFTSNTCSESQIASVKIRIYRFACSGNYALGMHGDIQAYVSAVTNSRPDILVLHCAQTWTTDALLPLLASLGIPTVLVSHGLSAYGDPRYATYFDFVAKCIALRARVVSLSARLEEGRFCAKYGLPPPVVIANGVDLSEWTGPLADVRRMWHIGQRPWFVSVSNHSSVKNHGMFRSVLGRISRRHPDVLGSIIGRAHPVGRYGLGRLGVKGGCWYSCKIWSMISTRVRLHENTSRVEVTSAIKEANVILVTSTREAAPLVILEAMAAGTPWVSMRVGSVDDNVGGVVVESGEQMVAAAERLLREKDEAKELGEAGRQRVAANHTWRKIVGAHEKLYQRLIEEWQRNGNV